MRITLFLLLAGLPQLLHAQEGTVTYVFVGTYTDGVPDAGIHVLRIDDVKHRLVPVWKAEGLVNPSYLALSPDGRTLYACTESKMPGNGQVRAFAVDSLIGHLHPLNAVPSGGENPVYVAVDATGRWVVNANYTEAGIALHARDADGGLGVMAQRFRFSGTGGMNVPGRQDEAHVHAAVFGPDNTYLYVTDLGADLIRVFHFDAEAAEPLRPAEGLEVRTEPGSGPRHLVFHPGGQFAYCVEELGGSVSVYAVHDGRLTRLQRLHTYAQQPVTGNSADVHVSPDGRHLYVSNRGPVENSLACFAIDGMAGTLTLLGHSPTNGEGPRGFDLDASGGQVVVANGGSDKLVLFTRDAATGLLRQAGGALRVPRPSSVRIRSYRVGVGR